MSAKGKRPTMYNWKSGKKFRDNLSMVETGTSGARKASFFLRNEDIILEQPDEGQEAGRRPPQSQRILNDS